MIQFLVCLFWFCLFLVVYTYVGYGFLLWVVILIKRRLFPAKAVLVPFEHLPETTLLIAAFNEAAIVDEKMKNCNALNFPEGRLHFVWVTDGSNDETNARLAAYPNVTILHQPERKGKTAALNRAMSYVESPLVVFTDANTMLNSEAIVELAKRFSDPHVGCVAGEKRVRTGEFADATAGEGLYWKYESFLKSLDDELNTAVGAAGELYAIRRELFEVMPEDTLLDDFVLSMRIAAKGYKIAYCSTAYALEDPSSDIKEEEKRKVRIAAGGLQSIVRLRKLLNPFKYGLLHVQYVSHRVLRWSITPLAFFALLPLTVILLFFAEKTFLLYLMALLLQVAFYAAGLFGYLLATKKRRNKLLYIPYYFLFMNLSVLRGFRYLAKHKGTGVWEKAKRADIAS